VADDLLPQETKYAYLVQYAVTGRKRDAARAVGTHFNTVARQKKLDPEFAAACDDAYEMYKEQVIETEVHRRGIEGWDEPVYQGGRVVGSVRKYDSALLLAHARRHIPEYREKYQVELDVTARVLVVPGMLGMVAATEAQWEEVHRGGQVTGGNGNGNGSS
jgi:hypothetical protein